MGSNNNVLRTSLWSCDRQYFPYEKSQVRNSKETIFCGYYTVGLFDLQLLLKKKKQCSASILPDWSNWHVPHEASKIRVCILYIRYRNPSNKLKLTPSERNFGVYLVVCFFRFVLQSKNDMNLVIGVIRIRKVHSIRGFVYFILNR